ncbi:MAG: MerR family transcriptional regulator [Eubacteriales bacterium]|nr:MerR family transcriptional regulator [Eubacteriales bacterium]
MKNNGYFSIGEVSKLFHISVSILRYYDKIGLVTPEYTDPATGYRYYSTRQFECLNTIRYLRALDMPLENIALFLQDRNLDSIQELLKQQKEEVRRRQVELARIERKIDKRLAQLADAVSSRLDEVTLVSSPARKIAALNKDLTPANYLDLEFSIRELEQEAPQSVTFLGKVGIGLSKEKLEKRQFLPYDLVFLLLDEEDAFHGETFLLPKETCLTVRFQGSHERAPRYYEMLLDYAKNHGWEIHGFSKEITMIDYGLTKDVSKFVTEIQLPVRAGRGA